MKKIIIMFMIFLIPSIAFSIELEGLELTTRDESYELIFFVSDNENRGLVYVWNNTGPISIMSDCTWQREKTTGIIHIKGAVSYSMEGENSIEIRTIENFYYILIFTNEGAAIAVPGGVSTRLF